MSWNQPSRAFHIAGKYTAFACETVRQQGWISTVRGVASEVLFDFRHGLRAVLPREFESGVVPMERTGDAVQYQGVNPRIATDLLRQLPADARYSLFVDYGCGKGRGLALGVVFGYSRLVGIEISPALVAIADRNLARLRGRHPNAVVEVRVVDAVEFMPPPGPVVAFLYNPFLGETLGRVVDRLRAHANLHPVWIVYINPRGLDRFEGGGFRVFHELREGGRLLGVILVPSEGDPEPANVALKPQP